MCGLGRDFFRPAWPVVGLSAKKFALRGLVVGVSAKKFSQRTKNAPKTAVCGVLGEFFRENTLVGAALGELFRGNAGGGGVPGELFRGSAREGPLLGEFCCGVQCPPAFLAGSPCPAGQTDPPCPVRPPELVLVPRVCQALGPHGGKQPVGAQAAQRHPHDAHRDPTERRHGLVEDAHRDEELQGRSQVL